jgi:DNA polymerase-3 subunit gamma/tau
VVDRCHRFDFARPSAEQVSHVLRRASDAEGIDLPDAARALIARKATGSFRDALGNLEQLVTYSGPQVALDDVLAVLGVADAELLFECADAVAAGDPARTLRAVARLAESGRDPGSFFDDLEDHARGLLVVQALGEVPSELRVTPELDERLAGQSQTIGRATVVRLLDLLAAGREARKAGADARVQLELALVKAAAPDLDPSQRALLARIERLEAALGGERTAPPVQPPPAAPVPSRPAAETVVAGAAASTGETASAGVADSPSEVVSAGPAVAVAEPETESGPLLDLDTFRSQTWPAVVETVRERNALLGALLDEANPVELAAGELRLAFAESAAFLKRKAEDVANRKALGEAVQVVTGRPLKFLYELRADAGGERPQPARLSDEELLARFMEEFDAEEIT